MKTTRLSGLKKFGIGFGILAVLAAATNGSGTQPEQRVSDNINPVTDSTPSQIEVVQRQDEVKPEPEEKEKKTTPPPSAIQTKQQGSVKQPQKPDCDPNYSPCVPNVAYDLNCPDIGFSVTVIGTDIHGFDGNDNDGLGCESY